MSSQHTNPENMKDHNHCVTQTLLRQSFTQIYFFWPLNYNGAKEQSIIWVKLSETPRDRIIRSTDTVCFSDLGLARIFILNWITKIWENCNEEFSIETVLRQSLDGLKQSLSTSVPGKFKIHILNTLIMEISSTRSSVNFDPSAL